MGLESEETLLDEKITLGVLVEPGENVHRH